LFKQLTLPVVPTPEDTSTGRRPAEVPFQEHVELLRLFLAHRDAIVERLQGVLNAQRKPIEYLQDGALLSRLCEDCFFTTTGITESEWRLRGQLEAAHWSSGFRPRDIAGLHNGPAEPAELMMRAFYLWRQTRWPGRNGRVRYAHTLFNLYIIRCLELLSMRVWDDSTHAGDRLSQVQDVLDDLWSTTPADQPVLVRDARWLIQTAQSLATDDLGAYFQVQEKIADTLPLEDRIAIHKAGVRMTGGHLRSQIRYYAVRNAVSLDDRDLTLITRTSNALDFALMVEELVPLLEAYEQATHDGDDHHRRELADAICQGISPDPDLFLNRIELLAAYSMIEHLFVATDGEHAAYTPMGQRHVQRLEQYAALIGRVAVSLHEDCARFRPVRGTYSPYGVLYGFSADLLKHMALKAAQPDAVTGLGLEDVFTGDDGNRDKLAWVNSWRKLPHLKPEVERQFDYPQQFAEDMFQRIEDGLRRRVSDAADAVSRTGRLFVVGAGDSQIESKGLPVPELPLRYIGSSDPEMVAANTAEWHEESRISSDRREGRCVLSSKTAGGWMTISKAILTEVLGSGRNARITGLPREPAEVLNLMCPGLVVLPRKEDSGAHHEADRDSENGREQRPD